MAKMAMPKGGKGAKGGKRSSSPLSLFGEKNGRAAAKESLPAGQKASVTPGDPVSRSQGQYGKGHDSYLPEDSGSGVSGMPIRNPGGGIRDRPRSGGLAAGFARAPEVVF